MYVNIIFPAFKAFSVATNETDGFKQFIRSAKIYNVPVEVSNLLQFYNSFFF